MSLTEVKQLRKALRVAQARAAKAGLLEYEVRELRKDLQGAVTHKETIGSQNREIVRLVAELRRLRDQADMVRVAVWRGLPARRCSGGVQGREGAADGPSATRDRGGAVEVAIG